MVSIKLSPLYICKILAVIVLTLFTPCTVVLHCIHCTVLARFREKKLKSILNENICLILLYKNMNIEICDIDRHLGHFNFQPLSFQIKKCRFLNTFSCFTSSLTTFSVLKIMAKKIYAFHRTT